MSSLGINIGLKSLLAAQASLETIGHNISNANTPGYSRQTLHVSASSPLRLGGLLQGTGIQADTITRTVDALLRGRISTQVSNLGRLDSRLDTLSNVESFLGGSSDSGAPALLKKMFQSFASLSTAPEDSVLRTGAVQSTLQLTSQLNQLASNATDLSRNVFLRLDTATSQVNQLAGRIGDLNRQIVNTEVGTATANDLRDERDQKLRELAQYVDVRAVEDGRGAVRVLVGGRILVSPTSVEQMSVIGDPANGNVRLQIDGADVPVVGGQIGGLLGAQRGVLPQFTSDLDTFARNLILEANRLHSTGVPRNGSFHALRSANTLVDQDRDGDVSDELLSSAGLPFDVIDGELYVNVVDQATGTLSKHRIAIDAEHTTAGAFASALNDIAHLSSSIDAQGRLQIVADAGWGFDFSARLDSNPDALGSFGSGRASLGSGDGPFALNAGDTLDFVGSAGAFSVGFQAVDFAQIGAATASEVAAALNADANFQASGLSANVVGGQIVVQSSGSGASESFQLTGGTALGAFGWSAGTTVNGSDTAAQPTISGKYTGAFNGKLFFRPNMDGTIGTTPGLLVEVFDDSGTKLTQIDVGPSYSPGDETEAIFGIKVAFDFGQLSASERDVFQLDVAADSDSADVLVGLGLNSFFTGSDASTIGVRKDIIDDPSMFAGSMSGAPGDGGNVLRFLGLESTNFTDLGGQSLDEHLAKIVSGVALEISATQGARDSEQFLLDGLDSRRDQISGVNTDEELAHMIEQEQAYNAAAQYLRIVNDLMTELMNIL